MSEARQSVARRACALCHALHAPRAPWLSTVEGVFRHIFENRIKRGSFTSVSDFNLAFVQYIEHHNMNPKPFIRDRHRRRHPRQSHTRAFPARTCS